jgi:amino acid transporter
MENNLSSSTPSIFLRKASGLVKVAGVWDVFIYNVGLISIGIGVAYTQRFGPSYYPGASITVATLFAFILMCFVVLAFWTWTTVIPRSGGIYVFLTRAKYPALGFSLSFVECVSWLFYAAIASTLMVTVGIIPLVAIMAGPGSDIIQTLTTPLAQLIIASIIIWLAAFLLICGTRVYLIVQKILFILAILGTLALLFALGSNDSISTFSDNFNQKFIAIGSSPYDQVINSAKTLGWLEGGEGNLLTSIPLLVWPFLPLIGSAFSIGIGGEVRNSARNQLSGMLCSLLFCTFIFILISIFGDTAIGSNFQGAIGYVFDNAKADQHFILLPFAPYFPYLACLTTNNFVIQIFIPIGFICWIWFWIPGVLAYTERAFLSWSLDRVAPSSLAKLHPRLSTPYISVIASAIIAQGFLFLILYTGFFATLVFILAATVAWCITLILGVIFPFTSPHIYENSSMSDRKLLGFPIMSILCVLGASSLAFVIYLLWNDSIAAGHDLKSLLVVGLTFTMGFVFFLVMQIYRRRQGIDLSRTFKEIPVE